MKDGVSDDDLDSNELGYIGLPALQIQLSYKENKPGFWLSSLEFYYQITLLILLYCLNSCLISLGKCEILL